MPFVRRTPRVSSRLFLWGTWAFFGLILYLCVSNLLALAGKDWPGLFPANQPEVTQTPVAPPPSGSILAHPPSILDQSVTKGDAGREQVRQLLQEGKGQ